MTTFSIIYDLNFLDPKHPIFIFLSKGQTRACLKHDFVLLCGRSRSASYAWE